MSKPVLFLANVSLFVLICVALLQVACPLASCAQPTYTLDSFKCPIDIPFNGTYSYVQHPKTGIAITCYYDSGWVPGREVRNQIISDIFIRNPTSDNSPKSFQEHRATIQMYVDDLKSHENITSYTPMDTLVEFNETPYCVSYIFKRTLDSNRPSVMSSGYGGTVTILHANGNAYINWFVADYDLAAVRSMIQTIEDRCYELWEGSFVTSPTISATPTSAPGPTPWDWTEWIKPGDYSSGRMIRSLSGTVEVRPLGSDKWYPAYEGMLLGGGWKLRTLEDGKAEVTFPGNRLCTLYSESSLEVPLWSEYYWSKRKLADLTITDFIELLRGRLYMWIKYGDSSGVITSNALAGDKGTGFEVIVDDSGTTFNVFEGELVVSDLNLTRNVSVRANQTTTVPAGGLAQDPTTLDQATSDAWWAWLQQVPDDVFNATPIPINPPASASPKSPAPGLLATILGVLLVGYLLRQRSGF